MVSKNNQQWKQQQEAQRVPHYGLRKLSVGVASVLLSTTLYMGVTAHADTTVETSPQPTVGQPASTAAGTSTGDVTTDVQSTADQPASTATNSNAPENDVSAKPAPTVLPKQPANATDAQPTVTTSGVQPVMNLAVESDNNDLVPKHETVDSQWTLHYVNQADHQQELKAPTVITMQYTRTNTPQSDGTIQYGDWSYVPGSFKQTGTSITVNDSDNPTKDDNVDMNGKNVDVFDVIAKYPTIVGYKFHDDSTGTFLFDHLLNYDPNGGIQAPRMSTDVYVEYVEAESLVDETNLTKTVTRTIKITQPDGTTTEKVQTVHLTRSATVDEVTNQVKYGAWSTDQWDAYKVPTVDGYTPSRETVEAAKVDGHTLNQLVVITYTQTTHPSVETATKILTEHFIYGEGDRQGKVAAPDSQIKLFFKRTNQVTADGTVVSYGQWELDPSQGTNGYQILSGQWQIPTPGNYDVLRAVAELPNGKKLSVDENREYHYSSSLAWLNPELSAVDYFADPDFYDVHTEHTTYVQAVHVDLVLRDQDPMNVGNPYVGRIHLTGFADDSRNLTWDEIVAAGMHDKVDLANYELVPGQTVTVDFEPQSPDSILVNLRHKHHQVQTVDHVKTILAPALIDDQTTDQTVDIYYTPNQHQINVEYVDDDDHGKVVKTDQVSGKTDQTITVTPSAPANYDLVDDNNRTYTVTSADGQTVQIHVKHYQVTTTEDKTVTRTINVHTPHDGVKAIKQTAELTREVTTDQVTGEKTYDDWTTGQWESYTPEVVPGYTPSTNEVPNANVDGSTGDQMVDVTYIADTQKVEIVYLDDTKNGAIVKTDQATGKTDETVKVTPDVPAGYELVGKVPGDYTMTADGHQTITVHLVHQTKTTSESKTITRTINVHTPHDGTKVVKQTATLTRAVTTDQVTGEKTYGDWSTTEWDHYAVPAVAGYVPSIEQVAQQVVNGTTTDQTIDVTYSSGEHTTHVNYVDGDGNTVHTTTITGQTDGTVQVPNETPAGWTVIGEPVPNELTFGPDGHADVTVTVDHQHVTVTPDQPKTPTDKLPDNPTKTYPNGVGHDDLNKMVVRTIKVTTPDGQIKTVEQTAKLTRTADVDEVTGEVTYGDWTTGEWTSYEVPAVLSYTPSQSEVPATRVTDTTKNQTVTIGYTANDQTTHVNYVDGDGKTVHTTTITGKTDQTVKVPNEVPTGWTVVGEPVPNELTFGPDGHADVTVTVDHQHVTVTPDKPQADGTKLPDNPALTFHGVGEGDLNRTITRTITLNVPGQEPQVITQTVHLTRTATVDEVTGEVTYGDWTTGQWDAYEVPTVDGYTADQTTIPAVNVTSETTSQAIVIDYVAVPTTPSNHQTDANQVTAATPNAPLQTPVTKAQAQKLPQTGETQNVLAPIGLALLGILSGFSLFAKKRKAGKDDKHQS